MHIDIIYNMYSLLNGPNIHTCMSSNQYQYVQCTCRGSYSQIFSHIVGLTPRESFDMITYWLGEVRGLRASINTNTHSKFPSLHCFVFLLSGFCLVLALFVRVSCRSFIIRFVVSTFTFTPIFFIEISFVSLPPPPLFHKISKFTRLQIGRPSTTFLESAFNGDVNGLLQQMGASISSGRNRNYVGGGARIELHFGSKRPGKYR